MDLLITGVVLLMWRMHADTLPENINIWRSGLGSWPFFLDEIIPDDLSAPLTQFEVSVHVLHKHAIPDPVRAYLHVIEAAMNACHLFENSAQSPQFEAPSPARELAAAALEGHPKPG